jgi:hypothetical protein
MRMHLILASFLGALLAAPTLYAQTPPAGKGGGGPAAAKVRDCSQASDPKACEERRAKLRDAYKKAEEACKDKQGPDRRACMTDNICGQTKDPADCKVRAEKRGEKRAEYRKEVQKACQGRKDDELRKCVRDERARIAGEVRKEVQKACEGKKDDELRKCVRDERAKRSAGNK